MAKGTQTIAGTAHGTLPIENSLEHPSFTIEFLEHVSPTEWRQWLDQIKNTVQQLSIPTTKSLRTCAHDHNSSLM